MDSLVDLLLWRASLAQAPAVIDVHDQIRLAERCLAQRLAGPARLLFQTAFLRQGFSVRSRAVQAETAARTGLWPAPAPVAEPSAPAGSTIEIAIAELQSFSRAVSGRLAGSLARDPLPHESDPVPDQAEVPAPGDLAELAGGLYLFLQAPAAGEDHATVLIARFRAACDEPDSFDYRTFAGAPLPLLFSAMAFASLREFFLANQEWMVGPFGSAEVLHRAARFDDAGLGPYLTNVARLAGRSRDVFELAQIAQRAGAADGRAEVPVERWIVLLSRHLTGPLRNEVVDDLGDLGAMDALAAMFDRAARLPRSRIERDLIMRLRDAALDNGDYDLASRAQALIVRLRPGDLLERMILGSIDASGGMIAAAEQSFLACLAIAPDHADAAERLLALRARKFDPFTIRQGFGTPEGRRLTRLRRREAHRAGRRTERQRLVAVEL